MSRARWLQCATLLALLVVPLCLGGLQATSYSGWPALGFAVALLVVAGRRLRWPVLAVELAAVTAVLAPSYDVGVPVALLGGLAIVLPALLTAHLLTTGTDGRPHLDEVDSTHYHVVTLLAALLCGLLGLLAALTEYSRTEALVSGLVSFLAALTALLVVLPLLIRPTSSRAAGGRLELGVQRTLLVVAAAVVFLPDAGLPSTFVVFPVLVWGAIRASRRETHVQLFVLCVVAYTCTYLGRGRLAGPTGMVEGSLPDLLTPTLVYLFIAACCYTVVPVSLAVERLVSMTGQATRAATTVERLLASSEGTMFIALDAEGVITHYNAGAEQTLGWTADEVIGQGPGIFHAPDEIARHARELGVAEEHWAVAFEQVRTGDRRDWEFIRKDGTVRVVALTLSEVTEPDGSVIGYIGAGDDITERVRAQDALVAALEREHASVRRLEEVDHVKQELVSNVSHELRTPITSISGYTELLADGDLGELTREQADAVTRIARNTSRLGLLVEDLLTLARAESDQLDLTYEPLDLRDVAREAHELLDELIRVRDLEVRLDLPGQRVRVHGDATALERVAMNLLSNAIKFTPDGGRVTLRVSRARRGALLVVSDTGIGISEEDRQHLFTRFYRARAATDQAIQGTGLGLSIVHAIVAQHGGSVSLDSVPGEGTTVTVLLPRGEDHEEGVTLPSPA